MLRTANPGSDIDAFIRIYRALFDALRDQQPFGLDDMSSAMVKNNLASSCGFVGDRALELSTRNDRSRDPLFNQSKMYSELYRMLGWIHPLEKDRLRFTFTFLGAHVVEAARDPRALVRECLLGIAFPNQVLEAKGDAQLRPFACILRTMGAMSGVVCRDEMIVGPLSIGDDRDGAQFRAMVDKLTAIRGDPGRLENALDAVGRARKISQNTMWNYTRFPIAGLTWTGWATKRSLSNIYGRPIRFLELTEAGKAELASIDRMVDMRASDLSGKLQDFTDSVTRLSGYQMLARAGFDLSPVSSIVDEARSECAAGGLTLVNSGKQLLFSPFHELAPSVSDRCFPQIGTRVASANKVNESAAKGNRTALTRTFAVDAPITLRTRTGPVHSQAPVDTSTASELRGALQAARQDVSRAVETLAEKYQSANQGEFYPLVAELFTLSGMPCTASRAGVNYQRADAMIVDPVESIPIEIKSPGEELFLSVKAVRQAAENKVILLARKAHPTTLETTSLAVGFNLPNDRSEVASLIHDIHKAFGIRIGVMDFRVLLRIAMAALSGTQSIDRKELAALYGIIEIRNS